MPDYIGEIMMRSGDQLPLFAVAIETDMGDPVDISAATSVDIILTNEDGYDPRRRAPQPTTPLVLPGLIASGSAGIVTYDWGQADILRPGIVQVVVVAHLPDGPLSAPTDRTAYITMRPDVIDTTVQGGLVPGHYNLHLYRGDSYAWQFVLWQDAARTVPVDLAGATTKAEIRNEPGGLFVLPMTTAVTLPNKVTTNLAAVDSVRTPAFGAWDLQVTFASGDVRTVLRGDVITDTDVTDTGGTP